MAKAVEQKEKKPKAKKELPDVVYVVTEATKDAPRKVEAKIFDENKCLISGLKRPHFMANAPTKKDGVYWLFKYQSILFALKAERVLQGKGPKQKKSEADKLKDKIAKLQEKLGTIEKGE